MRVDFCFMADAVAAPPDGKFYIHGGGVSRIAAPTFPFVIPQVAIIVRLVLDEDEVQEQHAYLFTFFDPTGNPLGTPLLFLNPPPAMPPPPLEEGEERFAVIGATVNGLTVLRPGPHRLEFHADGELMSTASFAVVPAPNSPAPTS